MFYDPQCCYDPYSENRFFQLVPVQRKVPDIEILLHTIFMHSLGDNYYAPVRLGGFPSFVIDAFIPERPMKNKDRRSVTKVFQYRCFIV